MLAVCETRFTECALTNATGPDSHCPGSQTNDRWAMDDGGAMDMDMDSQPKFGELSLVLVSPSTSLTQTEPAQPSVDTAGRYHNHANMRRSHGAPPPDLRVHNRRMPMRQAAPERDMVNMRWQAESAPRSGTPSDLSGEGHWWGSYANTDMHHSNMANQYYTPGSASRSMGEGLTAPGSPALNS
jgi:hypothetical protein